jgi:hypothetical protein
MAMKCSQLGRMRVQSQVRVLGFVAALTTAFAVGQAVAGSPPLLFVYPGPYGFADGRSLTSPQTMDIDQITTRIPELPELSGVVLMVYWSTLCPTVACDFSLIDKTLDYWQAHGKRVVLEVSTNGFPIRVKPTGPDDIAGATPDWVMRQIKAYPFSSRVLGALPGEQDRVTLFPDFRDPKFLDLVSALVRQLAARYDGHQAVARIRISTGIMGEDNPMVGPPRQPMAGYTEAQWLDYCRRVSHVFFEAYHRTALEFDLGRLSYMWVRGRPDEKAAVEAFINDLLAHHVMLAFNGLSSESSGLLEPGVDTRDGAARTLSFVKQYHERGGRTKLEALSLLSAPRMKVVAGIVDTVRRINPDELVFFIDLAQAGAKVPSHSPLEAQARQNGEQILNELGYR